MSSDIIIFPKYITIQDINHSKKYASRMGPSGVRFSKDNLDKYCYFEVEQIKEGYGAANKSILTNKLKLKLDNGNFVYTHENMYVDSSNNYKYVKDKDVFEFIKLEKEGNIYAIKGYNGKFVSVYDDDDDHKLRAIKDSIDNFCRFKIEEPIIKKEIININYDTIKADIINMEPLILVSKYIKNDKNFTIRTNFEYTYRESKTGTWNDTFGIGITTGLEFKAGIPFFKETEGSFKIEISSSYSHEWGGSITEEKEVKFSDGIDIPPMEHGKVELKLTKKLLSVPFTYTVKTTYLSGEIIIKDKMSGIYKNFHNYNVYIDTSDLTYF